MAITIELKVVPQSGSKKLILDKNGYLRCFVLSAAQDGKANQELIVLLAQLLRINQVDIEIIIGHTQRKKVVKIHGSWTQEKLYQALGLNNQQTLV